MASGDTHDIHGAAVVMVVGVASLYIGPEWRSELLLVALGVVVGTLWLSPDLDLTQSHPYKRWWLLRWYWWPYARLHAHRGISHSWVVGPVERLLWLAPVIIPLWGWVTRWHFGGGEWFAWWCVGTVLSAWVHLLGDRFG